MLASGMDGSGVEPSSPVHSSTAPEPSIRREPEQPVTQREPQRELDTSTDHSGQPPARRPRREAMAVHT